MLEESILSGLKRFLSWFACKATRLAVRLINPRRRVADTMGYRVRNVTALKKKNPSADIYKMEFCEDNRNEAKYMMKQLNRTRQNYVFNKVKDKNGSWKYQIVTTNVNKEYLNELKLGKNGEASPENEEKSTVNQTLDRAKSVMKSDEKNRTEEKVKVKAREVKGPER